MGTQKNRLSETVPLSTKNVYAKADGQENIYNFKLKNFVCFVASQVNSYGHGGTVS